MSEIDKMKDMLIAEYETLLYGSHNSLGVLHCIDNKYYNGKFNDQLRNIAALREQVIVKVKYEEDKK